MKFSETQHIAKQQLELLVNEQLDSDLESRLISHIDQCEDCQKRLERLVENGNEWSSIHQHLVDLDEIETPDESSIRKFMELLGPTDDLEMMGRLGQYEVSAVIGAGSTGIVAKAFERTLNRFVAIKVLHPKLCDSGAARKRFDREGRAIAAVVNPHVVPVFAISEHLGHPFIVMQYMPGGSLQQRIERDGQLSAEAVVRLGLHIAEGLEAAHEQGIVHRDVKPANAMLESGADRAMVSDFGLARVNNETSMTCSGLITGTPQYMSPEQARGETLDGRSDLFSLGSTLYAACTGHSPFRAANVFGVIKRVCDQQPRSILDYNPQTPAWLVAFIEVLMSKKKESRFQSAAEVRKHLSAELAHMQSPNTVSQPARPWQSSVTKMKRTTFVLWCTVAFVLALFGGWLVARLFQGPVDQGELKKAISRLVLVEGAPLLAFDFTKQHSIPVRDGGNLVVRSYLADITVETHDKSQVEIEAVISIAATNRKQAEALFGKHLLGIDLQGNNIFSPRTDLVEGRDAFLSSCWGSVDCDLSQLPAKTIEPYLTKRNQLSISHILASNDLSNISLRVKVPRQFNLDIYTTKGKVSLPDIDGNVNVIVNDGNITLGDIVGGLNVFVEDGFLLAGNVTRNATINGRDGDLELGNIGGRAGVHGNGDLKLGDVGGSVHITTEDTTKGAHVEVGNAGRLATVSLNSGRIRIGKANGGARLKILEDGNIQVTEVREEIQASTGEGTITVESIGQINADSNITTRNGAIRIGVASDTSVAIEARSEEGKIRGSLVPEAKTIAADIELNGGGPTLKLHSIRSSIQLDEVGAKTSGTSASSDDTKAERTTPAESDNPNHQHEVK